jgi:Domain of unknown function (DUF1874)
MSHLVALLTTSILTNDGNYSMKTIDYVDTGNLLSGKEILSAIGHESTAQILTELLGVDVPVNRIQFAQEVGQQALVFKMNSRLPEGKILSREEIEEIGYSFKLLTRTA